ncbi:MAG: glycerophosphodiester phosphodiesterase [Gemmatimonadota bacterium]|nr:glycerophosphodiester phosphodiesterase [Gemmatimonadota bacterium]
MPEIIAHRGASRERLENTLAAFERALELGADGVELDVHCTADGTVVVHHDPVLRGSFSDATLTARPIAGLTTTQVAAFRLGDGAAVPTLVEVARLLGAQATLYCELKGAGTAGPAIDVLRQSPGPSAVHAFDHRLVAEAALAAPELPRGVLEVSRHVDPAHALRSVNARDLWQLAEFIDEPLVRDVHAAGGRVIAWTANDPVLVERLAACSVDGLCTDDVALVRKVLGR